MHLCTYVNIHTYVYIYMYVCMYICVFHTYTLYEPFGILPVSRKRPVCHTGILPSELSMGARMTEALP